MFRSFQWCLLAIFVGLPSAPAEVATLTESEQIPLTDGSVVEGKVKSFTDDDSIIVMHENGVRKIPLTAVMDPKKSELRQRHAEMVAETVREIAEVGSEVGQMLADDMTEAFSEELKERLKPRGDEWILFTGIGAVCLGIVLMLFASFAEDPVWGIAFFLTSGLSWIPFFFLKFKRAWMPTAVCVGGIAMMCFFAWQRTSAAPDTQWVGFF